jgi:GDP-D-mannose dehydratase
MRQTLICGVSGQDGASLARFLLEYKVMKYGEHLLEVIRFLGLPVRFYNANSSECSGDFKVIPAAEGTLFQPHSPYAVAKSMAY